MAKPRGSRKTRASADLVQVSGFSLLRPEREVVGKTFWQDEAACAARPELFILLSKEDRSTARLNSNEIRTLNTENFQEAEKICSGCPAFDACKSDAEPSDRYWTVRAGKWPEGFNMTKQGRPRKKRAPTIKVGDACNQGHVGAWRDRKNSRDAVGTYRYCGECSKIDCKNRRARKKAALKAAQLVD